MNYILIDYQKCMHFNLQSLLAIDSEIYLFFDHHQHTAMPLSWLESCLNLRTKVHFFDIDFSDNQSMALHWAFVIGQIIAKDQTAEIKILTDEETFSLLPFLSADIHIEWLSPIQSIEKKTEIPPSVEILTPQQEDTQNTSIEQDEPKETDILQSSPAEEIIEKEETPTVTEVKENKKERLKKKAIISNEAEFIRFTTNYIFNLFASHLYLQKVSPPSLFIDLKNLLITEYFPPEENFALSDHTDHILENVFSRLEKKGFISLTEDQVNYHLSPEMIYQNFVQLIDHQQPKKYNGIIHIAKTELFFLGEDEKNITELIEKVKNNGHFSIQNKRVIYPAKKKSSVPKAKNDDHNQQQNLQLKGIKIKKNLSAHHPKISLLTPRPETVKKDNDFQFRLALQLIKSPNRPKSIKHLKRFLAAKIATDGQGIEQLIKRLFKERYIIVLNDDKITYRTELIRSSRYEKVVHFLKNGSQFKPREEEALLNAIRSCLGNKISQAECQAIVKQLIDDRYITIENGIAKYQL